MSVKFPSIEAFHTVRKYLPENIDELWYRAKIKLHGTNAGVRIKRNGEIFARSRTRTLTPDDDNYGFAKWVEENKDFFTKVRANVNAAYKQWGELPVIVFGEWCGSGIMKNVAISSVERKIFCVFAIQIGEDDDDAIMLSSPEAIGLLLTPTHEDIFVLPWFDNGAMFGFDFNNKEQMQQQLDFINKQIEAIDAVDPWVKETFGIEGHGEGLVFTPFHQDREDDIRLGPPRWLYSRCAFKAKGEKHKVVKQKKAVQLDPEVVESITSFVDMFVTPQRLEQGVREVSRGELVFEHRLIGPFLGWMGKDVQKESTSELEASGLEWKQVAKAVTTRAREWYLENLNSL